MSSSIILSPHPSEFTPLTLSSTSRTPRPRAVSNRREPVRNRESLSPPNASASTSASASSSSTRSKNRQAKSPGSSSNITVAPSTVSSQDDGAEDEDLAHNEGLNGAIAEAKVEDELPMRSIKLTVGRKSGGRKQRSTSPAAGPDRNNTRRGAMRQSPSSNNLSTRPRRYESRTIDTRPSRRTPASKIVPMTPPIPQHRPTPIESRLSSASSAGNQEDNNILDHMSIDTRSSSRHSRKSASFSPKQPASETIVPKRSAIPTSDKSRGKRKLEDYESNGDRADMAEKHPKRRSQVVEGKSSVSPFRDADTQKQESGVSTRSSESGDDGLRLSGMKEVEGTPAEKPAIEGGEQSVVPGLLGEEGEPEIEGELPPVHVGEGGEAGETDQKPGVSMSLSPSSTSQPPHLDDEAAILGEGDNVIPTAIEGRAGHTKKKRKGPVPGTLAVRRAAAAAAAAAAIGSQLQEGGVEEKEVVASAPVEAPGGSRAPRKKRKWLKKGEVDPDDPIAVARQRERHAMIDEAIENLDRQTQLSLDDTHPQLTQMYAELERRKDLQLKRLAARYEYEGNELVKVRDTSIKQIRAQWEHDRDNLQDTMSTENRHLLSRLTAERQKLRQRPHNMPGLRDGRGGGGWPFYDGHLLSTGEEKLYSVRMPDGSIRQRRGVDVKIGPADAEDIQSDLIRMGIKAPKNDQRPPSRTPSPSSSVGVRSKTNKSAVASWAEELRKNREEQDIRQAQFRATRKPRASKSKAKIESVTPSNPYSMNGASSSYQPGSLLGQLPSNTVRKAAPLDSNLVGQHDHRRTSDQDRLSSASISSRPPLTSQSQAPSAAQIPPSLASSSSSRPLGMSSSSSFNSSLTALPPLSSSSLWHSNGQYPGRLSASGSQPPAFSAGPTSGIAGSTGPFGRFGSSFMSPWGLGETRLDKRENALEREAEKTKGQNETLPSLTTASSSTAGSRPQHTLPGSRIGAPVLDGPSTSSLFHLYHQFAPTEYSSQPPRKS